MARSLLVFGTRTQGGRTLVKTRSIRRSGMLLMNLKTNENERKLSLPVQLSLFGFLVFSLVVTHAEKRPVTPRFLEIEEKEVVVSVFDRLRSESPDFADSVSVSRG